MLSLDPAMRGWVSAVANDVQPVASGGNMRSFAGGERMCGVFGWRDDAAVPVSAVARKEQEHGLPVPAAPGVPGLNGATACLALGKVGLPRPGGMVVGSTAAGSC